MAQKPRKRSLLFRKYPEVKYTLQGIEETVRNVMVRAKIKEVVTDNARLFYSYDMADGDTPEMIAHKYYEDVNLHWIILLTNMQADGRFGFGMNYNTFVNYIKQKYPGIVLNTNSFTGDIAVGARITGENGAVGTVVDWNPNTGRIAIQETSGDFAKGTQATTVMISGDEVLQGQMQFGQYKIAHEKATHHYENTTTGDILDYSQFIETPVSERREVSNITYEQELNQEKRTIRLIKPQFVQSIVEEMSKILDPNRNVV